MNTNHEGPPEIGSRVYYSGDVANIDGWFIVTAHRADGSVDLVEQGGEFRSLLGIHHIGVEYHGHCNPRFVTEQAIDEYRAARQAEAAALHRQVGEPAA